MSCEPGASQPERVSPAQVDLWVTQFDRCHDQRLLSQYASLLSAAEQERWRGFVLERDRHAYLVSHALVRTVLGRLLETDPRRLEFAAERRGKPYLLHPPSPNGSVAFNLSHTRNATVLCTTAGRAVGTDIECMDRKPPFDIAHRCFSPAEVRELEACAPGRRAERFWSLWTLKEAYLKATGAGLSEGLDNISFAIDGSTDLEFAISAGPVTETERWHFAQWSLDAAYMIAVCVERTDAQLPAMRFTEVVPLQDASEVSIGLLRSSDHRARAGAV
jgi:4'-phosphopantetheinyl transferase